MPKARGRGGTGARTHTPTGTAVNPTVVPRPTAVGCTRAERGTTIPALLLWSASAEVRTFFFNLIMIKAHCLGEMENSKALTLFQ